MANFYKLSLSERILIESGLNEGLSPSAIAKKIDRSLSTIIREIKNHISEKDSYGFGGSTNRCTHRATCEKHDICPGMSVICKKKRCASCRKVKCNSKCPDYFPLNCETLSRSPYVCNGCDRKNRCNLIKRLYIAETANNEANLLKSSSRSGFSLSQEEIDEFDSLVSVRVKNGQSLHHIFASSPDVFTICERTGYRMVNSGLISAKPIDMPRTVQRKPRRKSRAVKVDKNCRVGRTFDDYIVYLKEHPDTPVLQGDSVIGVIGGKCILTLTWVMCDFQIGILREHNNSASVTDAVNRLYETLGPDLFLKVFPPVWLLDNGSEFSNPTEIEKYGIHVFYCDPNRPDQKGACENTHEHFRRIVPQGTSFDMLTQNCIDFIFSNTNAFYRKKLNNRSPYDVFSLTFGSDININEVFNISYVDPKDVILTPRLLSIYQESLLSEKNKNSK